MLRSTSCAKPVDNGSLTALSVCSALSVDARASYVPSQVGECMVVYASINSAPGHDIHHVGFEETNQSGRKIKINQTVCSIRHECPRQRDTDHYAALCPCWQ